VSFTTLTGENRRVNAFSIIPHPQPELFAVVPDFDLDLPCPRVAERVPQRFGSNLVDLVPEDGVQIPRLTLNGDAECRSVVG